MTMPNDMTLFPKKSEKILILPTINTEVKEKV